MPTNSEFIYWDSCVFLSYLESTEGRIERIDDVLEDVSESDGVNIIVSSVGVVEVAFVSSERGQLDPQIEQDIDALWNDPSIQVVELHLNIAHLARKLVRDSQSREWSLKPHDAAHLATAMWCHAPN